MVVQHNLTAMNASRMLGITTGQQAKASEKLSSGYKINRAADDAAGLAISEKMRKQINGLERASTNAQDGVSAVQTAEGALQEVHAMLQRMNELAVQAANGTNSNDDRAALDAEVQELVTEINRVSTTTKFNELYLLNGTGTSTGNAAGTMALKFGLHVGTDSGETNRITVAITAMNASAIGLNGVAITSEAAATAAIVKISNAIQYVSKQRSALGAIQNRLEHTIANLDNVVENTTAAESRIRDTDMAEMMVEYSKNNILAQAGQSMLAQANQSTQGVLSLLQ